MEQRVLFSGFPITEWSFDNLSAATNLNPAPSTGSGTASSVGMQSTGTTGVSPYPTANATGPDTSNITATGGGATSDGSTTNVWKIVGTNGWNSSTALASQGAQFTASTSNYTGVNLKFDWYPSSQGEQKLEVEYTTNGGTTWNNALNGSNATVPSGVTIVNNSTGNANISSGYYINCTTNSAGNSAFFNGITVDLSGVAGAQNLSSGFGVRLVNAANGSQDTSTKGTALNNTSGNWSFDEVDILGTPINPIAPSVITNPTSVTANGTTTATFSAAAQGTPTPSIQWQMSSGSSYSNVGTVNSSTYSVTASTSLNGDTYRAVFINSAGTVPSNPATLTVYSTPTVTVPPSAQAVAVSNPVTFTATGFGPTVPSVTWQLVNGSGGITNLSGASYTTAYSSTTGVASLTFTPLLAQSGDTVQAVFSTTSPAASTTSAPATLTVYGIPVASWNLSAAKSVTAPAPAPNVGVGSLNPLGMSNDFLRGYTSVTQDDITSTAGTLNTSYKENLLRVRGGNGVTAGAPSDGWSADSPNEYQGLQFNVSTVGFSNIVGTFDWYSTTSGMKTAAVQYTTDDTANPIVWTDYSTLVGNSNDYYGATATGAPSGVTVNLQGVTAVNNDANFAVRIVAKYQQSTNPSDGTTYLPPIYDGNQVIAADGSGNLITGTPDYHGQFATAQTFGTDQIQEIAFGGTEGSYSGTFTITVPGLGTTAPIPYDTGYGPDFITSNEVTDIYNALNALKAGGGVTMSAGSDGVAALDTISRNFLIQFASAQTGPITINTNFTGGTFNNATNDGPGVTVIYAGSVDPYTDDANTGGNWRFGNINFTGVSTTGAAGVISQSIGGTATLGTGGNANVSNSASAYIEGGSVTEVYWQQSSGSGWTNLTTVAPTVSGNTYSSTYTFTATSTSQSGTQLQAVFQTASGALSYTSPGTILVVQPLPPTFNLPTPAGNAQIVGTPSSVSVLSGTTATFTANAYGLPFTSTTVWQMNTPTGWVNVPSGDVTTTVNNLANGYQQSTSVLNFPTTAGVSLSGTQFQVIFNTSNASITSPTPVTLTVLPVNTPKVQWDFGNYQANVSSGINAGPDNTPTPNINYATGTLSPVGFTDPNFNPPDGSVPFADVNSTPGTLNSQFIENTWRIRGVDAVTLSNSGANGWDTLAPQYSQGAEIDLNTTNLQNIYVHFDWYQTAQGARDLQEQYCLNTAAGTPVWVNIGSLLVANNGGDFYGAASSGNPTGAVVDLTGVAGANNNPNLGIRLVSAYDPGLPLIPDSAAVQQQEANDGPAWVLPEPHGQYASATLVNGQPVPLNGTSGNWRFGPISVYGGTIQPTWLTTASIASGGATWNGSSETLTVTGNATIIGDPLLSGDTPTIVVTGSGNLQIDNTAHINGLNISGGASVTLNYNASDSQPSTLVVAAGSPFIINGAGSKLDIGSNFVDLKTANASAGAALLQQLASSGELTLGTTTGIVSSNSAINLITGVGAILNSGTPPLYGAPTGSISTTFGGVTPGSTDVLIRDTYLGDANLDGQVTSVDYTAIDNGFLQHLTGWAHGDFNGDGVVNGSDYTLIDNAYNTQGSQLSPAAQIASNNSVFAGGIPPIATPSTQFASVSSITDLLKKDQADIVSGSQDVVDALNG